MNHTNIQQNLAAQVERAKALEYLGHTYTIGELNSIAKQGIIGETDVFGDALWLVDFSFWAAAHVQQSIYSVLLTQTCMTN